MPVVNRLTFAEAVRKNTADSEINFVNRYVVPVNPVKHRKPKFGTMAKFKTLDGPGGYQYGPYANTVREYEWGGLSAETRYKNMATQLREYRGKKIWLKEGSAGISGQQNWHPAYIIDIIIEYEDAPNTRFYYKSIKLIYAILPLAQYSDWDFVAGSGYPNMPPGGEEDGESEVEP